MPSDQFHHLIGRLGGHAAAARHDRRDQTSSARAAFLRRFLEEVDPERVLPEDERERRAESARKAHMARLSLLSAQARAKSRRRAAR